MQKVSSVARLLRKDLAAKKIDMQFIFKEFCQNPSQGWMDEVIGAMEEYQRLHEELSEEIERCAVLGR